MLGKDLERGFRPSIFYDCDTLSSFSGSMVLNSANELVAIHWGTSTDRSYNQGIPLMLLREEIEKLY